MTGHTIGFALGLFVAVNGYTLPPLHVWSGYKLSPHDRIVLCADAEAVKAPADMRVKELKEELDNRGVSWRGVAFEKAELVNLLEDARNAPPAPPPSPEPEPAAAEPTAAEQTTTAPADDSAKYDEAYTAALAEGGLPHTWGDGEQLQLGHGDRLGQTRPRLVEALAHESLRQIECGSHHCVAISGGGDVYSKTIVGVRLGHSPRAQWE